MTYNSTVLADSPTLYFPYTSGTLGNQGGSRSTSSVTASASVTSTTGFSDQAMSFSTGTTGYIEYNLNTNDIFSTNTWTVEAWFKRANTTDAAGYHEVFNTYDANNQVAIYGDDSTGHVALWYKFNNSARTQIQGPVINDTNWHHAVATCASGAVTFYIDGVAVGTGTASGGTFVSTTALWIGAYGTSASSENWHGLIDEIALWKGTSLSATRVQAHYTASGLGTVAVPPAAALSLTSVTPTAGVTFVSAPAITLSLANPTPTVTGYSHSYASQTEDSFSSTDGTVMSINGPGGTQGYVQFADIAAPPTGKKTSALLQLTVVSYTGTGTANNYNIYRATQSWAPNSGGIASVSHVATAGATFSVPNNPATLYQTSVDISSIAQEWAGGAANYGVVIVPTDANGQVVRFGGYQASTGNIPQLNYTYVPLPPDATITPPAATLSLGMVVPAVHGETSVTESIPAMSLSMATTGIDISTQWNVNASAPAAAMSLYFPGGTPALPDFNVQPAAIGIGLTTPAPNISISYPTVATVPPIGLSLDTAYAPSIDLTTNVLKVAPVMGMSLNMVGIFDSAHDRYFNAVAPTLDADDIWYKLDEASGSVAHDSSVDAVTVGNWVQNGTLYGNFTAINDGPQLRKGIHFDGLTSSLRVGPYGITNSDSMSGNVIPPNDVSEEMAVTVEFSLRTTATDGVVFMGTGARDANAANNSPLASVGIGPVANGNELRLEAGYLVFYNAAGKGVKVRNKFISDGQWHHIIVSIPAADSFYPGNGFIAGDTPSYCMVDGDHALVRYGAGFHGDSHAYGGEWLPWDVMARNGGTGFLAGDLSSFIVRLNKYTFENDAQSLYYAWSDANVINPTPVALSVSTVAPAKVKGSVKKMLALYGLPFTREYVPPATNGPAYTMYNYMDVLSGMVIQNFGGNVNLQTRLGGTRYWPAPKSFMIDDYMVVPVSIFGNLNNSDSYAQSASGALNTDVSTTPNGIYVNDETGHPRFINLQDDLSANVVDEYDVITVLNYPWEKQDDENGGEENYVIPFHDFAGMTDTQWEQARDDLRDSIMEAVYDGASLWIGDYYMAQHLGFIQGYDIHDFDRWNDVVMPMSQASVNGTVPKHIKVTGPALTDNSVSSGGAFEYNLAAQNVDNLHLAATGQSHLVGSGQGDYFTYPQANFYRRITALVPGLTDLPGNDYGQWVEGWNVDDFLPNGNFVAYDILRRPNGLQLGDHVSMQRLWMGSKFYGETTGTTSLSKPTSRVAVTSAHPDGICGTVVSREQESYFGPNGVAVQNPYKDNALTIAAEQGTVVRGRPIGGRVFIELMGTDWGRGYIPEDVDKTRWHGSPSAEQGGQYSTWDYDSRREMELKNSLSVQTLKMSDKQGAFNVQTKTTYFFTYSDEVVTQNLYLPMAYRGLQWLAAAPQAEPGSAKVYASAMELTITEPNAAVSQTASPASQVVGAMRLDLQIRQPANYADGNVEERVLPLEMSLEMRGLGRVVSVPPMSLTVTTPNPTLRVAADTVTVYLDEGRNITLFLKEDN